MDRVERFTPTELTLNQIAELVVQTRPDWEIHEVRSILRSHAHQVDGADLAVAAIRCATNRDYHRPAAIGWRGPHWDGLGTLPPQAQNSPPCDVCNKPESRCYGERVGKDDDHDYTPRQSLVVR